MLNLIHTWKWKTAGSVWYTEMRLSVSAAAATLAQISKPAFVWLEMWHTGTQNSRTAEGTASLPSGDIDLHCCAPTYLATPTLCPSNTLGTKVWAKKKKKNEDKMFHQRSTAAFWCDGPHKTDSWAHLRLSVQMFHIKASIKNLQLAKLNKLLRKRSAS